MSVGISERAGFAVVVDERYEDAGGKVKPLMVGQDNALLFRLGDLSTDESDERRDSFLARLVDPGMKRVVLCRESEPEDGVYYLDGSFCDTLVRTALDQGIVVEFCNVDDLAHHG